MTVIWKDQLDHDSFHVGVKYTFKGEPRIGIWATIHIDAISDLFGPGTEAWARVLPPGLVFEVDLTLKERKS